MENKTMRKMMIATLFTAACGSIATPPAGNNGSGSDMGSDTGSDMGSDMGSGSGSGSTLGMACSSATDCGANEACDIGQHECVAAAFTLDKTGFIDDGTRWWTSRGNPSLAGTIENPTGASLEAYIGTTKVGTAILNGTAWAIQLPANSIAETDTLVTLRLATSTSTLEESQLFALDDKAPTATLVGSIKDERGDTIDFSTGEAVHTHAGAAIDLSGTGCPSVYTYAYLMDETAPTYGRETAPNPLAWQITVADSTGIDSMDSAYRVRDASGAVLYDWTSISPDASGVYAVRLFRNKVPALGTKTGHMFVDARFRDPFGNESTKSVCFDNHPMAVPLQVSAFARGEVFGWTLTADAPIHRLMDYLIPATLFSQDIVQYANEPITIQLSTPAANIPYTLVAVDDIVVSSTTAVSAACSPSGANCNVTPPADPADRTTSGTISTSELRITLNGADGTSCSGSGLSIACVLPARGPGEAPKHYSVTVLANNLTELQPFNEVPAATWSEYTVAGLTYTGRQPIDVISKCSRVAGSTCVETSTYTEIRAADEITMQFPALARTVTTSIDSGVHWEPIAYATGSLSLPAKTWDSGNDDLPGPQ